jgi:hypothetical protein
VLSFEFLQGHLSAHVIHEKHELSLDLLAQEVNMLSEGMLAVSFRESFVSFIVPQPVSHIIKAGIWGQEVSGFV